MNKTLIFSGGFLLLLLLAGCSSPPELTQPDGKWVDINTHLPKGEK